MDDDASLAESRCSVRAASLDDVPMKFAAEKGESVAWSALCALLRPTPRWPLAADVEASLAVPASRLSSTPPRWRFLAARCITVSASSSGSSCSAALIGRFSDGIIAMQ